MDPITQKIISLTKTPDGESISSVFDTYCWLGNGDDGAGIHTSQSTVDMTKGGMVMGKRFDTSSDWYVTDTVTSPLDGSQGTPGYGNAVWKGHPSDTGGAEQDWTVPAGVTSVCILCIGGGEGTEMVMPGDNVSISVELISPIAMEEGVKFAIREGGRTVGAGQVTKVIE